jgi:hypothetical protein
LRPVADYSDAWPEVDGPADAVAALGNEDDALSLAGLQLVDRRLNSCAIVSLTVGMDMELLGREVDGSRVIQSYWIRGSRKAICGEEKRRKQPEQRFHGINLGNEYGTDDCGLPMRGPWRNVRRCYKFHGRSNKEANYRITV